MLFLVTGVVVGDNVGMQGFSDPQRELLDADSVTGHLLPAGSVFGFLAEHRLALFPAEMFTDLFPSGRGRPSGAPDVVASVLVLQALHGLSDRQAAEAGRSICGGRRRAGSRSPTPLSMRRR